MLLPYRSYSWPVSEHTNLEVKTRLTLVVQLSWRDITITGVCMLITVSYDNLIIVLFEKK